MLEPARSESRSDTELCCNATLWRRPARSNRALLPHWNFIFANSALTKKALRGTLANVRGDDVAVSDQLILLLAHVRSLRDEIAQLRVRGVETIAEIAEIHSVTMSCCDDTREMLFRLRSSATEMLLPTAR